MLKFLPAAWLWSFGAVSLVAAPDLILHGGKIVTVDDSFSVHQSMAISGRRILLTGSDEQILALRGPETELLALEGKMVLPGLIDSHVHPLSAALTEFDHPIPEMESIADVLDYFRGRAAEVPAGEWLVLQQVFITRLREQRYPTRAELDQAAPDHPVVFRTGPDASLNSAALQRSGIDRGFEIPAGVPGKIEKDDAGEPTGILRSFANYVKIPAQGGKASLAEKRERLAKLIRDYNASGITSIADRNANAEAIALYEELLERGELTARVSLSGALSTAGPMSDILENVRRFAAHPLFKEKNDRLRLIGVKAFLDGGMLTGSAYMREPWGISAIYAITDPAYRGTLFIPPERLLPIVRTALENGLQFTAHSVGDGAVLTLLDVYEEINRTLPVAPLRPCITHGNFMSPEAVAQMARLGVVADIQPAWLHLDARTLLGHFGDERLRWFQPLQSLFQAGAIVGGGSDHMQKIGAERAINPYNPFLGMATAITRQARWLEGALHPKEALDRPQAIRFYTWNNAYLLFQEAETGSLAPGKLADFIILDRDLLSVPIDQFARTQVWRTYLDGQLVHQRE